MAEEAFILGTLQEDVISIIIPSSPFREIYSQCDCVSFELYIHRQQQLYACVLKEGGGVSPKR